MPFLRKSVAEILSGTAPISEAPLPFGGVKGSGNGTRESGIWVIEAYSYWHAVNDELSGKLQLAQMDVEDVEMAEAEVDWTALG